MGNELSMKTVKEFIVDNLRMALIKVDKMDLYVVSVEEIGDVYYRCVEYPNYFAASAHFDTIVRGN